MLEGERTQFQKILREKQTSVRDEVNDLKSSLRAEKQFMVRLQMEKQDLTKQLEDYKGDLTRVKSSEKGLKTELR